MREPGPGRSHLARGARLRGGAESFVAPRRRSRLGAGVTVRPESANPRKKCGEAVLDAGSARPFEVVGGSGIK